MNDAHVHLVVNHLPIVGLLIGILVLIAGWISKKSQVKTTALGIFIFCAITALIAHKTGENAEEMVEQISGISHELIHEHEEATEPFFALMIALGFVSIVTLYLNNKKSKYSQFGFLITFIVALAGGYTSIEAGTTGGEIRHTEIRSDSNSTILQDTDHDDED